MSYRNEINEQDAHQLLADLPDDIIEFLLSYPELSLDLLEHATFCEVCGLRIEQISSREVEFGDEVEPEVIASLAERKIYDLYRSLPVEKRDELSGLISRVERHLSLSGGKADSPDIETEEVGEGKKLSELLPAEIIAAGRKIGLSGQRFLERLVGFSVPIVAAAKAATGNKKLVADLRRFRGGSITLELEKSGYGNLRGRFDHPKAARVFVYDVALGRILPVAEESGEPGESLQIKSGDSLRRIRLNISEVETLEDLRLIAVRAE